ncbi:hypothetical protein SK128_028385 [Halocaridina rubra]|uniref:Uncharacterized protein n=1 Tax=Halocaridina rubra TaxID=373956 RepID=A0AAN9ACU2_HALRR
MTPYTNGSFRVAATEHKLGRSRQLLCRKKKSFKKLASSLRELSDGESYTVPEYTPGNRDCIPFLNINLSKGSANSVSIACA